MRQQLRRHKGISTEQSLRNSSEAAGRNSRQGQAAIDREQPAVSNEQMSFELARLQESYGSVLSVFEELLVSERRARVQAQRELLQLNKQLQAEGKAAVSKLALQALIALPTGAGKTLIAAEVIRERLPAIKAAQKTVVFLAPTNPLVAQQCRDILVKYHSLNARPYHGDESAGLLSTWNADSAAHVYTPAQLTWRRAALVNNSNLARVAAAAGLHKQLSTRSRPLVKGGIPANIVDGDDQIWAEVCPPSLQCIARLHDRPKKLRL
eukprot:gene12039-12182_t